MEASALSQTLTPTSHHWVSTLRKHWRLFVQLRKISLMRALEYRMDFFFWSSVSLMWTIFHMFFFALIVQVSGEIGGWSKYELYVLLSVFTLVDAFTWSFFYQNMKLYTRSVFSGEMTQLLTKPVDTQFFLMVFENGLSNLVRILLGTGMLIWSLNKLQYTPSFSQLLLFIITFIASVLFLYFFWFILSTFSFWVDKLDNINEIIPSIRRVWQVPRSVYTGIVSLITTVLLPLGLITTIPSEVLLGKASSWWIVYFLFFVVITVAFSRFFLRYSLQKYVGVGN